MVPDSSFEIMLNCPTTFGMIYYPPNPPGWPQTLTHWYSAVANSPDYYNGCSTDIYSTVPNNYNGYHPAHTGVAYTGIVTYSGFLNNGPGLNYREYIATQLTQPMTTGDTYNISMWVKFLVPDGLTSPVAKVSVDRFGVHISNTQVFSVNSPLANSYTSLQNSTAGFLSDTSQWVKISGQYTATGGEQFITIGTFNDGALPAMQPAYPLNPAPGDNYHSYYLVDDVSVTKIVPVPCDTLTITHDTLICAFDNTLLKPEAITPTYVWSTGAGTQNISVSSSGTYWRIATLGCDATIDTSVIQQLIRKTHPSAPFSKVSPYKAIPVPLLIYGARELPHHLSIYRMEEHLSVGQL